MIALKIITIMNGALLLLHLSSSRSSKNGGTRPPTTTHLRSSTLFTGTSSKKQHISSDHHLYLISSHLQRYSFSSSSLNRKNRTNTQYSIWNEVKSKVFDML